MLGFIGKLFIKSMGGTRNERIIRSRLEWVRAQVNPLEAEIRSLSDDDLRQRSLDLRARRADGENRKAVMSEAFALTREASRRGRAHRQYDVQLVAGMVLDEGWVAEEATGEGKTIACYPAVYMAWIDGMHSHVVTTNDYLVERDAEFARPIFERLGLTVGFITSQMDAYGGGASVRKDNYACDVTYGTNSEFGFDYLRDNMKNSRAEQVQSPLDFAIIDEVDSILIDEARTPLIISGPSAGSTDLYRKADTVSREIISRNRAWDQANQRVEALKRDIRALGGEKGDTGDALEKKETELQLAEGELENTTQYYEVELDHKSVNMTHEGVGAAQEVAGVGSFYVAGNMEWPHLMDQSLRAHLVYERDKEYVVQEGQIIIVDEFTGRLMHGRQWSDGLHQAVEAKEHVKIKDETQTIATITIQNYFRMYQKLSGMTGTAMTEAGEFMKIYTLDVAAVDTHRPINRVDYPDRIYGDPKAKLEAIAEEVNNVSKTGRPVLVGTTSIEKSEMISQLLTRQFGVEHELLNGRVENAAREAEIVIKAGQQRPIKPGSKTMVGNVTIATNMAGRGTDIKLGEGVVFPTCKVPDDETLVRMGFEPDPLYPAGTTRCCVKCAKDHGGCERCFKPALDTAFPSRGLDDCADTIPCGLHIVGTERHESRRIDNQLRGRAGRQGDPGSSRFFLSLRDDLLSIFMGEWTVKVLGWLGLQGDDAIEDKRISKGIARAQRKVEERNFEIRKNLLEYDEIMDHQRSTFYAMRQKVLEGHALKSLVLDMIDQSVTQAAESYLDGEYRKRCVSEWARTAMGLSVRPDQLSFEDPDDQLHVESRLRQLAIDDATEQIAVTTGEYIFDDAPPEEWDVKGLCGWAKREYNISTTPKAMQQMNAGEIKDLLLDAARERIEGEDLSGVGPILAKDYAARGLADWAASKFDLEFDPADLDRGPEAAADLIQEKAREVYARRQVEYPVEYALEMTIGQVGTENVYAMESLCTWTKRKYGVELVAEDMLGKAGREIYEQLLEMAKLWIDGDALEAEMQAKLGSDPTAEQAKSYLVERFVMEVDDEVFATDEPVYETTRRVAVEFLRREMTELERYVLLNIFDSSWKDHLLNMDHLKGSIGLRSFAEQDPKVAFKREGGRQFEEMFEGIREKVTDMIFKVRLLSDTPMESVYQVSGQVHEQLQGYDHLAQEMAENQQEAIEQPKVETIRRDDIKVGRNDPCPCGSGKKYKKCCGR